MANVGDRKTTVIMTATELLITVGLELARILPTLFTNLRIKANMTCKIYSVKEYLKL